MDRNITKKGNHDVNSELSNKKSVLLGSDSEKPDDFKDNLLKLIPAEVIATYVTIENAINASAASSNDTTFQSKITWAFFILLFILNPIYLFIVSKVTNRAQLIISTLAFPVWVLSLGGPFLFLGFDKDVVNLLGAIILPAYTLISTLVITRNQIA